MRERGLTSRRPLSIIAGTHVGSLADSPLPAEPWPVDCSVVIVNYRTDEVLADCLASLTKTGAPPELEVIVVDNGGTLAAGGFRGRPSQVRPGAPRVPCLTPDPVAQGGALAAMIAYLDAHPGIGAVGARLLESDGSLQYSCRRFPGYLTIFFGRYALLTRLF